MTIFYCFADKAAFEQASQVTVLDENGNETTEVRIDPTWDVIGEIIKKVGGTEDEPIFEAQQGYHVNTLDHVDSWAGFEVFPVTPYRVFWR